jgi:hypothetical protein
MSMFVWFVGFAVTVLAVGSAEASITDSGLMQSLIVGITGGLIMGCGLLMARSEA